MARAFAVFGNEGRTVTPIAIRSIEDRNGRVVIDVERDVRLQQRRLGNANQVISPQNAYIMTKILEKTVEVGTLANGAGWGSKFTFQDANGRNFRMPVAGKTGTPQNWSDAWAIGYSPYYTTAIWFGFDKPGNSLGVELTGSTLAGPVWGDFMRIIHQGLPRRDFAKPATGIIDVTVCAKSGLLRTSACNEGEVTLPFLEGTQPVQYCTIHGGASQYPSRLPVSTLPLGGIDETSLLNSIRMPTLNLELLPELAPRNTPVQRNTQNRNTNTNTGTIAPNWSLGNPLLDDNVNQNNAPSSTPGEFPDRVPNFIPPQTPGPQEDEEDEGLPSWNPLG
jgi:penicillin-binding protein 1A